MTEAQPTTPQKDPNDAPSVRSASFTSAPPEPQFAMPIQSQAAREQSPASSGRRGPYSDLGPAPSRDSPRPTPPFATPQQSQTLREQSPASSGRRGPYPDLGPAQSQESPRATPTKRRTSWLPQFGSHSGRLPSREKELDTPKRSASHDITSMLSRVGQERRRGSFDGGHKFRPPFFHHRSGSQASPAHYASPQNSFGPRDASPQKHFGPEVQYASQEGSYIGTPGTQSTKQRSGSLPLPPGVTIESREVSSIASGTPPPVAPPVAPQIHLDLPSTTLKDEHWLSTSSAHTGSPHVSAASSHHLSNSPRPSNANSSRHHSGVPSLTDSQRLENEERRDSFNVDKELPSLLHVQDDHEHTGVKPPVPIGKYQPSWDPFNATPIQEEREGSEYSFGAGKISPPKLSPPNLETVNEGGSKHQDASQNSILAGAAGIGLAEGAATTVAAVAEQVADYKKIAEHKEEQQERKTEINTTEVDEDDLYDASPPPKSKRRSMDLRPAVSLGLAADTNTMTTAIHQHVEERQQDDEKDKEWEVVKHADVARDEHVETMVKKEESYFPPITERFTTATPPQAHNTRLDLVNTQDSSTEHSRNVSSVSAVSAMTDTATPGEIVQAEEATLAWQSPPTKVVHDATAAPPTIQSIVHGIPWTPDDDTPDGDRTPGGEGLQTFTPPRTGLMDQPPQNVKQNIVHEFSWSPTPEDDDQIFTPPRPGFIGEPAQGTPTMEGVPGFFPSTPSVSEAPGSMRAAFEKDKPLPSIDKELPYEHPDDISSKTIPRLLLLQPPRGPHIADHTAWEAVTSEIPREETPSVVSSEEDDEKPYAAALARLDNVRNNTQQINGELHPEQRSIDEAERFRIQNAQIVAQSRELESRERAFGESEEFRVQNPETVAMAGGATAWTAMTSHVIAEQGQDNSPSVVSEHDDEKPYVTRESEPMQRAFDEADKFRVQNAQIIEEADGGAAAVTDKTSSASEEDDDDDEKPYVMILARLDNVRNSIQQTGNELQPQEGMMQSRESEPRQRSFNEAEQFRVQNAQSAIEVGAKIDRKSEGNGVLAGAAGLGLAAGAATTAHAIAEQAQVNREQRNIEVNPSEIDEDDIYDASPPPKSKRRSIDMRPAVSLGPSISSLPPPGPNLGAIGQRRPPTGGTPVFTPQRERGLVPSEFTARTASTASTVQPPPVLAQEHMVSPRSLPHVTPVEQQRQFSPPVDHDQTVHRHSASQIRQTPYTQPLQGKPPGPPRLQHQDAEYGGKTPEVGARDSWFRRLPMHQQQRMSQPPPQQQQLTNEERMFQQHQGVPPHAPAVQPQPMRHPSTEIAQQQTMRKTQSPVPFIGSLPPPSPSLGAVDQRGSPTGVTPVLVPRQGRGPVPSEFTPQTGSAASSIPEGPPVLAQERTTTVRSPLGVAPVQQQRQFPPPIPQNRNQNQTAYQQSADQIGVTPYNRLSHGPPLGPPRGQHQAYAQQLAQSPRQLEKTNSDVNRHVLQKRPSSAASSQKGKEVKEKKKSWLSGLLGGRRKDAMVDKGRDKDRKSGDASVPLVAVLGATGMAAQHQILSPQNEERQRYSLPPPQHQMSGVIPPQEQQFDARHPSFLQSQKQQRQQVLMPPAGPQRQLQGGPQREQQQQYASPPIPGPYAYVRGDGSYGPVNQGPMILNPHQQQQAAGFRQSEQPVFTDQRSYDEYMRQQQAAQAQQQGHYVNLPPPPAQSYYQGTQESVPPNFRRASQEYVRDLNQRSSQEYSRRDSNPMAGGQQLNQTYTQQHASQRPQSQRKEPIAVAIPAWKRAIRDTPGTTSPVQRSEPSPAVLGPQGDFPHLTAYNPNSNKTPDTPEPQGHLRPFLGLNDGRRNSNLSTEDLLARSPARAQFGQQAPYQLSLPGGDDDEDLDSPHSRRSPPNALVGVLAAGTAAVALGAAAASSHENSKESAPSPLRESHQHQASNVPVPETAFSPIADRGDGPRAGEIPPPPIPKWSAPPTPSGVAHNMQLGHPAHHSGVGLLQPAGQSLLHQQGQMLSPNIGVGRSNTVMSDVSSVTVDSSHTPSPRQTATIMGGAGQGHGHKKSISAASPIMGQQLSQVTTRDSISPRSSPNDTPIVGNAMSVQPVRPSVAHHRTEPVVQRIHIPSDIRSPPLPVPQGSQAPPPMPTARAPSPPLAPVPAANATGGFVIADDRAPAERPAVLTQHPDHSGLIYDNSREGLIVVEDATVRRVNQGQATRTPEDDEGPVMSATSFPGDEWRPYGWDDGGFD